MSHKLNDTWTDEGKLSELQKQAEKDRNSIRSAVALLRSKRFPVPSVEVLQSLSPASVSDFIEKGKKDYLSRIEGFYLPQSIVDSTLSEFAKAEEECVKAAKVIEAIFKHKYEGVPCLLDRNGLFWWKEKPLLEFLTKQVTYSYSEDEKNYYTLLGSVIDSLNELHSFEKQKGWVEFSIRSPWTNVPYIQDAFMNSKGNGYEIGKEIFNNLKKWKFLATENEIPRLEREQAKKRLAELGKGHKS